MTKRVYAYDKCGTCRNALKWLVSEGIAVEVIPIVEQPPAEAELREWIAGAGKPLSKWFNTSGELYRQMNLKTKLPTMSEDDQIQLLAAHGKLLKRPIVTDGKRTTVGFQEAEFAQVWGGGQ
jgi:arsenate reductase